MKYWISLYLSALCVWGADVPSWFTNTTYQGISYKFVGYGEDKNLQIAIQNAKGDIASQISTHISTSLSQNHTVTNDSYDHKVSQNLHTSSNVTITDAITLHQEKAGDTWYAAVEYENLPTLQKFIKKLPTLTNNEPQNSYLRKTILFGELEKSLNKKIDVSVIRKDGAWYLNYKDILQSLDERSFEDLFSTMTHENVTLSLNKNGAILRNGEKFSFTVSTASDGFVSLLNVFEDGSVALLASNIKITKNKSLSIPDEKNENIYEAATLTKGRDSFDLFVVIVSDQPLKLDRFIQGNETIQTTENTKSFDKLISLLDSKSFATLKITTKK